MSTEDTTVEAELTLAQAAFPEEIQTISRYQTHISVDICWKGCDFALQVRLPLHYPSVPPLFLGIDKLRIEAETATVIDSFTACLKAAYTPGQTCLIEAMQFFQVKMQDIEVCKNKAQDMTERVKPPRTERSEVVDLGLLLDPVACSICLEEYPGRDAVLLECKHAFCVDCFAGRSMNLHSGVC